MYWLDHPQDDISVVTITFMGLMYLNNIHLNVEQKITEREAAPGCRQV